VGEASDLVVPAIPAPRASYELLPAPVLSEDDEIPALG
jgi:hypothetical protein